MTVIKAFLTNLVSQKIKIELKPDDLIFGPPIKLTNGSLRNTVIRVYPKPYIPVLNSITVYYNRIHDSELLSFKIQKGSLTRTRQMVVLINSLFDFEFIESEIVNTSLPDADIDGGVTFSLEFEPTSIGYYSGNIIYTSEQYTPPTVSVTPSPTPSTTLPPPPTPTVTPSPSPTPASTPTPTVTPSPTVSSTPSPTPTVTTTPTPTSTPPVSATPTPTTTVTPSPSPTPAPAPTAPPGTATAGLEVFSLTATTSTTVSLYEGYEATVAFSFDRPTTRQLNLSFNNYTNVVAQYGVDYYVSIIYDNGWTTTRDGDRFLVPVGVSSFVLKIIANTDTELEANETITIKIGNYQQSQSVLHYNIDTPEITINATVLDVAPPPAITYPSLATLDPSYTLVKEVYFDTDNSNLLKVYKNAATTLMYYVPDTDSYTGLPYVAIQNGSPKEVIFGFAELEAVINPKTVRFDLYIDYTYQGTRNVNTFGVVLFDSFIDPDEFGSNGSSVRFSQKPKTTDSDLYFTNNGGDNYSEYNTYVNNTANGVCAVSYEVTRNDDSSITFTRFVDGVVNHTQTLPAGTIDPTTLFKVGLYFYSWNNFMLLAMRASYKN